MEGLPANQLQIYRREESDQLWTTSVDVATNFGKRHDHLLQTIRDMQCSEDFRLLNFRESSYQNEQNKSQPMYEISRDGFTLLVMGFTGKKAMRWKETYIAAFNAMEKQILKLSRQAERRAQIEWQQARLEGKVARREETDHIKAFVKYAQAQGSKNARWYYRLITETTYKTLGFIEKSMPDEPIRELLDRIGLAHLTSAEFMVAETLESCMRQELYYKDIFQRCKEKLEQLAQAVGKRRLTA